LNRIDILWYLHAESNPGDFGARIFEKGGSADVREEFVYRRKAVRYEHDDVHEAWILAWSDRRLAVSCVPATGIPLGVPVFLFLIL
jgi:hypothetical protein